MNKQKELWDKLAKENFKYYINSDFGHNITNEEFKKSGIDDYIEYIFNDELIMDKVKNGDEFVTIVDLGCGTGRLTEYMADDFDQVIGIDVSGEMIRLGREKLEGIPNITLMENDGETIPLEDNSVDIVFSYLVFQHIKDREIVAKNFEEVSRILKPKGIFKVLIRSDKVDVGKWWGGVDYTEQTMGLLIKDVGFDLLKTQPRDEYGFWVWMEK